MAKCGSSNRSRIDSFAAIYAWHGLPVEGRVRIMWSVRPLLDRLHRARCPIKSRRDPPTQGSLGYETRDIEIFGRRHAVAFVSVIRMRAALE
jgi:hypothetical protein